MLHVLCSFIAIIILAVISLPSLLIANKVYDVSNNDYFLTFLSFVLVITLSFKLFFFSIRYWSDDEEKILETNFVKFVTRILKKISTH
jgi:hypothetical protein